MANCPFCNKEINATKILSERISSTAYKFGREMYSCKGVLGLQAEDKYSG